jgi:rRNA maturation endonuclease Nob1
VIPTSLGLLVFVYTSGLSLAMFALWLARGMWRQRVRNRNRKLAIRCALCGTLYQDFGDQPLPACPQCKHPNERSSVAHDV